MAAEMDKMAEVRTGEPLEAELRKNTDFLQKQKEWREAIRRFDDMVSASHEQWTSLQSVEDVFLEYNSVYGKAAYRMGYSHGVAVGVEQEPDGRKSILSLTDMINLICVYDAVRQLKKVLLGRPGEHWEDGGAFSVFESVFNIICNAASTKISFLGEDKAIGFIAEVLSDETAEPEERAKRLLGMEQKE